MKESVTYQAILKEGIIEGLHRAIFRQGNLKFGAPDDATKSLVKSITDLTRLEEMIVRLLHAKSWQELLAQPALNRDEANTKQYTQHESSSADVRSLLAKQSPEARKQISILLSAIETDDVVGYTTRSDGGDIRHSIGNRLFSEIEIRNQHLWLVLTLPLESITDPTFQWNKPSSGSRLDRGRVRIGMRESIPKKIFEWIERAKDYVR